MPSADLNITSATNTTMMTSHHHHDDDHRDEQVTLNNDQRTTMKTGNVDDGRANQRDGGKGERKRREQERTRAKQTSTTTDSVTSFTNEQDTRSNIIVDSMTQRISSSFPNNHSQPNHIAFSDRRYSHKFLSNSSHRDIRYLDEEILSEEILEVIHLNHYPTLLERWGDDTKTIVREEGQLKIEDNVEFEELEPTITEEIYYELSYVGDQIQSTREIHHSRSESRNFRKIRKRRIKRRRSAQSILTEISDHNDDLTGNIYQNATNDIRSEYKRTGELEQTTFSDITVSSLPDDTEFLHIKESQSLSCSTGSKDKRSSIQDPQLFFDASLSDETEQSVLLTTKTNDQLPSTVDSVQSHLAPNELLRKIEQQTVLNSSIDADSKPVSVERLLSESSSDDIYEILPTPLTDSIMRATVEVEQSEIEDSPSQNTSTETLNDFLTMPSSIDGTVSNDFHEQVNHQTPGISIIDTTDNTTQHELEDHNISSTPTETLQEPPLVNEAIALSNSSVLLTSACTSAPIIHTQDEMLVTDSSDTPEATEPKSITPLLTTDKTDDQAESSPPNLSNAFISTAPVPSEPDSKDFRLHQYLANITMDQKLPDLSPFGDEQSDGEETVPDLANMCYESQEERQPQPLVAVVPTTDVNISDHAQDLNPQPFSSVSNLPSREYRQVFGASDQLLSTVDDSTHCINQTQRSLGAHEELKPRNTDIDQQSQIIEIADTRPWMVPSSEEEQNCTTTSNTVSSSELDFRYGSLLNRIDAFINRLIDSNGCEKHSTESLEDQSSVNVPELSQHSTGNNSSFTELARQEISINISVEQTSERKHSSSEVNRMEDILTSIVPSKPSSELNLESTHSIPDAHQQEVETKKSFDDNISSSPTETLTVTSNEVSSTDQNQLTTSITTSRYNDLQQEQSSDSPEIAIPLIKDEEEFPGASDQVREGSSTITDAASDLDLSDTHTVVIISPSSSPDRSIDHAIGTQSSPTETVDNAHERLPSTYPWYSRRYRVASTEFDRLPSPYQSLIDDHTEQIEVEEKSSHQQPQVINDDYQWYSSYYSIVDAESKIAEFFKQSTGDNERTVSPKKVQTQSESQDKLTSHNNNFEDETDTKPLQSPQDEEYKPLNSATTSSYIDSKSSDLFQQTDVSKETSLISDTIGKKKPKKKSKVKRNITATGATSSPVDKHESHTAQLHSISSEQIVSTVINTPTDEWNKINHAKDATSTTATLVEKQADIILQSHEESTRNEEPHLQISSPAVKTISKLITPPKEDEDNDGFQLVRYHKRILSASKPTDIPATPAVQQTTTAPIKDAKSESKRNKHKKQKKETGTSAGKVEQDSVEEEIASPSLSTIKDNPPPTITSILQTATPTESKPSISLGENEDNEGFQLVSYRKRQVSAPRSTKVPVPSPTKTAYRKNIRSGVDLDPVLLNDRPSFASRSLPRSTIRANTPPHENKHQAISTLVSASTERLPVKTMINDDSQRIEQRQAKSNKSQQELKTPKSKKPSDDKSTVNRLSPSERLTADQPVLCEEIVLPGISTAPDQNNQTSMLISAEDAQSSTLNKTESIPLSVEETVDQLSSDGTRQVPLSQAPSTLHTSTSSDGRILTNTIFETITSCTNESMHSTDDVSSPSQSINSTPETTTTNQTVETITMEPNVPTVGEILPLVSIESTETSTSKKRRKKNPHTKQKPNDEILSTPSVTRAVTPPPAVKTIPSSAINSKLDLFLPAYILQQTDASRTPPPIDPNKSDVPPKKKQRPKMLNKDYEAKSLLTNEFDTIKQQPLPTDASTEQPVDDILSHGFHRWFQESQTLTKQQKAEPSSTTRLTHAMQCLVIQPVESTAENEKDGSSSVPQPIYTVGVRPEKRIHSTNGYFIYHPLSTASSSRLTSQSADPTSHDDSQEFHSDDTQHQSDQSSTESNNAQPTTSTVYPADRSINNKNCSISFDDWAHFHEPKSALQTGGDVSTSFPCFYSRTFDEETLLSDTNPLNHQRHRYGDFLSSNDDCLISQSFTIPLPSHRFNPSEYFEKRRKQKSHSPQRYSDDDEISLVHSSQGVSRQLPH